MQVFDPAPWAFAATAMTRALVVSAGRDHVLAWVGRHPSVSAHLLQRMARRLAEKSRAGHEPPVAGAGARVAREVLALADRYTVAGVVEHGLTQQQLADIVGLSRERVNKVLGDFCDRRWTVVGRGCLTVLNRVAVEGHAHHRPIATAVDPPCRERHRMTSAGPAATTTAALITGVGQLELQEFLESVGAEVPGRCEGERVVIGVAPPCGRCLECVAGVADR